MLYCIPPTLVLFFRTSEHWDRSEFDRFYWLENLPKNFANMKDLTQTDAFDAMDKLLHSDDEGQFFYPVLPFFFWSTFPKLFEAGPAKPNLKCYVIGEDGKAYATILAKDFHREIMKLVTN